MSNLSTSSLAKLSVWKQSLRNKKAGLPDVARNSVES